MADEQQSCDTCVCQQVNGGEQEPQQLQSCPQEARDLAEKAKHDKGQSQGAASAGEFAMEQ